jgi:dihydrolipoamide dehydrogenase
MPQIPKSVIVIGAGAIGVEFAYIFSSFGAQVSIVEMLPQILPVEDEEIAKELTRAFRKKQISIHTSAKVASVHVADDSVTVVTDTNGQQTTLTAEYALMAIGVQPNSENLGWKTSVWSFLKAGLKWTNISEQMCRAFMRLAMSLVIPVWRMSPRRKAFTPWNLSPGKSRTGQLQRGSRLHLLPAAGRQCRPDRKKSRELGREIKTGRFMFRANGKAIAAGETDGLVKVIFDAQTREIIGAHIIGAEATELLPELTLAVTHKMTFETFRHSIHAHPTLSEAIIEAAHDAFGESVHQ